MATRQQQRLNRAYRSADINRVGSSLSRQGYRGRGGTVTYTVGGVTYDAASGPPVSKPQQQQQQQPSSPRPAAVTSGSSSGGRSTPPASRPASSSASRPASSSASRPASSSASRPVSDSRPGQTGDKAKDMESWRKANPKLAEALDKRNAERGTSKSTNPQMADMLDRIKQREDKAATESKNNDIRNSRSGSSFGGVDPADQKDSSPSPTPSNSPNKPSEDVKNNFSSESITKSSVKLPESQAKKANSMPNNTSTAYSLQEELQKRKASR